MLDLRPGDPSWVGEYALTARLGEGGQGTVYLAEAKTGGKVAVKLMRADLAGDREASERFVREVSLARRVAPFCTAQVIETGMFGQRPYIVSEYVAGPTLGEVVRAEGPRSGSSLHRLAIGTVTALVAIHQAGIVHRDFKPSNVVLAPDGPRVIDFGIARALDLTSSLTAAAIGTPSFMAPEQLVEGQPGPASDLFAWACTLLYAASGHAPFGTDSLPAVFNRIMNVEPDLAVVADPALRSLVADCLAKDPARRPTASQALMRLLGHTGSTALLAQGSAASASPPHPTSPPHSTPTSLPPHVSGPQNPAYSGPQTPNPSYSAPQTPNPSYSAPQTPNPSYSAPQTPSLPYSGPHGPGHSAPQPPPPGPAYTGSHHGGHPSQPHTPGPHPPGRPAAPYAQPGQPTRPAPGRSGRWAIVVSVVAAVVVLVAVIYVAVRLTRPPQGTGGTGSMPSLTPTTQPPPSPEIAPTGTALKLPGAPITLTEHASDPIRLASYSVDGGTKLYVRQGRTFVANADYFEYALSPDGKQALATDRDYTTTSYAQVSIVQHATGSRKAITLSKAPIYPTTPRWSPDGGTGLVTLYKAQGDTSVAYGFGTIDIATGTVRIFPAKEKGAGEWRYFWAGDDRVATWAGGKMRFYDLDGKLVGSEGSVGSPLWVESGTVSPSGEYFLSHCTPAGTAVCAHPVSGGGEAVTIPLASTRLIGWFGDDHIAGWVADGTGQKAVIVDLRGDVKRVLATTTDPVALGKMGLRFTGA